MTNKEPWNQDDFKKAYDSLLNAVKDGTGSNAGKSSSNHFSIQQIFQ